MQVIFCIGWYPPTASVNQYLTRSSWSWVDLIKSLLLYNSGWRHLHQLFYCKRGNFRVGVIFAFFAIWPFSRKFPLRENKTHKTLLRKYVKYREITPTWKGLPTFSWNFPPAKITTFTVLPSTYIFDSRTYQRYLYSWAMKTQHPNVHQYLKNILNILSKRLWLQKTYTILTLLVVK